MAFNKFGVAFLLFVCCAVVLEVNMEVVDAARVCPFICYESAGYMTCPSSGVQHLNPSCNCCLAGKGCTIYTADGTRLCTGN